MMWRVYAAVLSPLLFALVGLSQQTDPPSLPQTPRKPVVDEYHGVKVSDPYRWLEDTKDPSVRKWVNGQNRFARDFLDKLPAHKAILDRLKKLIDTTGFGYDHVNFQDGKLFALSGDLLVTVKSADDPDSEKILVDAATVSGKKTAVIDFYQVSPDSKKVAVSISADGREDGTVYVFELEGNKKLPDVVSNVKSPLGGSMIWKGDSSGFYYTRNPPVGRQPKPGEPTQQLIYYHALGKDTKADTYVWGRDLSPLADTTLNMSSDDKYLLATVTLGWANDQFAHYLIENGGKMRQIGTAADKITSVSFGPDDDLYLLCWRDAPRGKIVRLPLERLDLGAARTIVPESAAVMQSFLTLDKNLLVQDRVDGFSKVRVFDLQGKALAPMPVPAESFVSEIVPLENDTVLFLAQSYVSPPAWYECRLGKAKARKTKLITIYPNADFKDYEVVREQATSKDGTRVPMTILRRKGQELDGARPVLLTAYGGYGLTLNAEFEANRLLWLEQGGVLAIGHLRGDGDFGETWHRAGILTKRQNAFDDFAACARHLIERKYTSADKLAIEGASNGGLLMGVALTQHPRLFRAAVAQVGIFDILRHELKGRGFDVPEFGTVKEHSHFKAMYAYSPYHHVVDETPYPSVLFITGENDGRVDPSDTWKMAARMQVATSSKRPILLWTSENAGHQIGAGEVISQRADIYAFLLHELGVEYKAVGER
jgi:prolyl oligopeptidase